MRPRRPARLFRLVALCRKETLQILRDPSTLLIAFVFPVVLLVIFGYGINLDSSTVRLGLVLEDDSPPARRFAQTLARTPSFRVVTGGSTTDMADRLRRGDVRGFVVVRQDFGQRRLAAYGRPTVATVQVVTDGAEPNTASFVAAYVRGAYAVWSRQESRLAGQSPPRSIEIEERAWFNPTTTSRNFLLPGSITIIMTVVGALLTSLVVAREWERGTMEALLAAGVTRFELVTSKVLPYFFLGLAAFAICVGTTVHVFHVPLRGSYSALLLSGATFLGSALGMGLLISTALRSQYDAAQAALNAAFLPAMTLSGFVFEISSMPAPIRVFTHIVPARYFVAALQTLFQAGDLWPVLGPALAGLALAAVGFIGLTITLTRTRLE